MKNHVLPILLGAVLMGTVASAESPFVDVPTNNWAYQSVKELAANGIISGYPDGTFKGNANITRYEMAQMVAKALANQDKANTEQQAEINRLATEFDQELNNLGVRVATLEKKVGNVRISGDTRIRAMKSNDEGYFTKKVTDANGNRITINSKKKSQFDFRERVQFAAKANDNTTAVIRLKLGETEFGDTRNSRITVDRAYVVHDFTPHIQWIAGRYNLKIGDGLAYDDAFDGTAIVYHNGSLRASFGHGAPVGGYFDHKSSDQNPTGTMVQVRGNVTPNLALGSYYIWLNKGTEGNIYGFEADYTSHKIWLGGEWLSYKDKDDSAAWMTGIGYGKFNMAKKGSWDIKTQYFNQGKYAPIWSSTWNQPYDFSNSYKYGYKGWLSTVDYALLKNVGMSLYYAFSGEDQNGTHRPNFYRAEVNYSF